jgi:hypothetical protein
MLASLELEAIGHNTYQYVRLWTGVMRESGLKNLAEATFGKPSDFARWGVWEIIDGREKPVYGKTDYSRANSKGSRGVRIFYALESGKHYLVKAPESWGSTDVYRCRVTNDGTIVRE